MTEASEADAVNAPAESETYPFDGWERRTRWWAGILAALALLVCVLLVVVVRRAGSSTAVALVLVTAPPVAVYVWQTRRIRRRRAILRGPFPAKWEAVLQRDVVFFRVLAADEQRRFRQYVQVFLGEKRVTGVGTRLDATTRVLVAASAIIPIFGFPDWEWDQISEVLVYPNRFDNEFQFGDKRGHGMVGTGSLNRVRVWLDALDVQTLFIEPGRPWENGYVESFNRKLRDELLNGEIFSTLTEARIVIERWRRQYNTVRPHSALGYRPPAPEAVMPTPSGELMMSPVLS